MTADLALLCVVMFCTASCATRNKQPETSNERGGAIPCSEKLIAIPDRALASRQSFLNARESPRYSSMNGCTSWDNSRILPEISEIWSYKVLNGGLAKASEAVRSSSR